MIVRYFYDTRPFRERVFIVLWCLCGLWAFGVIFQLSADLKSFEAHARAKVSGSQCSARGGILAPETLLEPYRSGQMTTEERLAFDQHVKAGRLCVPPGFYWGQVLFQHRREQVNEQIAIIIGVPLGFLMLVQYLTLGIIDPVSLFRRKRQFPLVSLR
jgi:hypothetical protein